MHSTSTSRLLKIFEVLKVSMGTRRIPTRWNPQWITIVLILAVNYTQTTALSDDEKQIIRSTWKPIQSNPKTWPRLFVILFTDYPETQKKFKSFAGVPIAELEENSEMKMQSKKVAMLLSEFIDSLDNLGELVKKIEGLATRHYKIGIALPMFDDLGNVLIKWLKQTEPDKMDDDAVRAWKNLYGILYSVVEKKYSQLEKESS